MSKLKLVLKTARPLTSAVAGLAMFNILLQDSEFPVWKDALQSLPIVLATMTGFILNDIFDYEKDSRGKLRRPIALGLLDMGTAWWSAVLIAFGAIFIEAIVNQLASLDILAATLVGVLLYSPLSKHFPPLKGIATAFLTLTPIIYASVILQTHIPPFIYFATAIFIIGREILLDAKDFERDIKSGIKTLVYYFGIPKSTFIAWLLMFTGVVYFLLNLSNPFGELMASLGLICLVLALLLDHKKKFRDGGITLLTMILCILAVPFAI